jgi:hypothetical protein
VLNPPMTSEAMVAIEPERSMRTTMWVLFSIDGAIVSPCRYALRIRTYVQDTKGVGHNYPNWLKTVSGEALSLLFVENV